MDTNETLEMQTHLATVKQEEGNHSVLEESLVISQTGKYGRKKMPQGVNCVSQPQCVKSFHTWISEYVFLLGWLLVDSYTSYFPARKTRLVNKWWREVGGLQHQETCVGVKSLNGVGISVCSSDGGADHLFFTHSLKRIRQASGCKDVRNPFCCCFSSL